MPLPVTVEASGMQLEIMATFSLPLPPGLSVGLAMRRSKDGCADLGLFPPSFSACQKTFLILREPTDGLAHLAA